MRKIIYTRPDGGLSVVSPATSEQDAWSKLPQDAISPRFVEASDIPADRSYRNGWKDTGVAIRHDMPKCRNLHRQKLRELRTPKLLKLDADYLRADELGDTAEKARISSLKRALRDITAHPAIDAATTIEELKVITIP